jgi:hypothetical protein
MVCGYIAAQCGIWRAYEISVGWHSWDSSVASLKSPTRDFPFEETMTYCEPILLGAKLLFPSKFYPNYVEQIVLC